MGKYESFFNRVPSNGRIFTNIYCRSSPSGVFLRVLAILTAEVQVWVVYIRKQKTANAYD